MFRILSIDGGGIRGILPGQILVALEEKLREKSGNAGARIADYFDLIAGTSTGGILTCLYLCPLFPKNPDSASPQAKFSASEAVKLYLDYGNKIFGKRRALSMGGWLDEKYSEDELEKVLKEYFGELKLSQLLKPCLITAYDIRRRKTHFFKQHKAEKDQKHDFLVRDVARATSAAPTYFELPRVMSLSSPQERYPLIDGGVFANNPALCAYAEARTCKNNASGKGYTAKDMFIFSLGTTITKWNCENQNEREKYQKPYYYNDAKDWGKVEWVRPVLDIMMSGVTEAVHYQLEQIFDSVGKKGQYVRIEPQLGQAEPDMDDATPENLMALKEAGEQCARDNAAILDRAANLLVPHTVTSSHVIPPA